MAGIRNRIVDHILVKGRDLQDNAGNFRVHPQAQVDAMGAILQNVGIVDELLVYDSERYGGRTIIDGHLRKDLHPDVEWPCTLTDLNDDEADAVLATFDYLTGKADVDHARQAALIQQIQERDTALLEGVLGREEMEVIMGLLPDEGDWADAFGALPDGERAPFQQMTFTLHDSQVEQVKAALGASKKLGEFVGSPNENSNGNALARICETFLTEHGQGEGHHTQAD